MGVRMETKDTMKYFLTSNFILDIVIFLDIETRKFLECNI